MRASKGLSAHRNPILAEKRGMPRSYTGRAPDAPAADGLHCDTNCRTLSGPPEPRKGMFMAAKQDQTRRTFIRTWVLGALPAAVSLAAVSSTARAATADLPLLSPDDPTARKVKYTEDASQAKAPNGNKCSNCALYEGTYNSTQGPCQIFPGKHVKAAGWCSSWAPQI